MNLFKALSILKYKIKTEQDADVFDALSEYVKLNEEKTINQNILFAKLYAIELFELSRNYNDNIDFANERLNQLLMQPLSMQIQKLSVELNFIELNDYLISIGAADPFFKNKDPENVVRKANEYPTVYPQININKLKESFETWDYDRTFAYFKTQINQSFVNFKNLP